MSFLRASTLALRTTSSIDRTPINIPSPSITGRRLIPSDLRVFRAVWTSSSGVHVKSLDDITDRTQISEARLSRVPNAIEMSRSVITPITFPPSPATGRNPQALFHISSTAWAKFVSGPQDATSFVITSQIFVGPPPLFQGL